MKNLVVVVSYMKNYFFGIEVAEVPKKTNPHVPDLPPYVLDLPPHGSDPPPRIRPSLCSRPSSPCCRPTYLAPSEHLSRHYYQDLCLLKWPDLKQTNSGELIHPLELHIHPTLKQLLGSPYHPVLLQLVQNTVKAPRSYNERTFLSCIMKKEDAHCSYFKWVKFLPQKVRIFIELQTSHFIF